MSDLVLDLTVGTTGYNSRKCQQTVLDTVDTTHASERHCHPIHTRNKLYIQKMLTVYEIARNLEILNVSQDGIVVLRGEGVM